MLQRHVHCLGKRQQARSRDSVRRMNECSAWSAASCETEDLCTLSLFESLAAHAGTSDIGSHPGRSARLNAPAPLTPTPWLALPISDTQSCIVQQPPCSRSARLTADGASLPTANDASVAQASRILFGSHNLSWHAFALMQASPLTQRGFRCLRLTGIVSRSVTLGPNGPPDTQI